MLFRSVSQSRYTRVGWVTLIFLRIGWFEISFERLHMPDINKLVPRALATGTAAVAIGSTVKSIADDLKQAQARNANTVAAAGGATLTKTLTSKKKDDIQERVIRSKAQTARKTLGYPLDESPFEVCFHFIKYQPGNDGSSGRNPS